jgi:isoleucyl-tRNA synthetase
MQLAQDISSLVLSLRKKLNIKVRQPLHKVLIPVLHAEMKTQIQQIESLIKAEVNVKQIEYLADTEGFIKKKIKPNFKMLGSKLGANMKEAAAIIANFTQQQIATLERNGHIEITLPTSNFQLQTSDVDITAEDISGWSVASKGNLTVALDITITDELKKEGEAREFVNRIQNIRKEKALDVTDKISIAVEKNETFDAAINDNKTYICGEILADEITWMDEISNGFEIDVNGTALKVTVSKKQ